MINHWTLRIYLSIFGIVPLNIRYWIRNAENLAFIRRSGANIKFYHSTLEDYFYTFDFPVSSQSKKSRHTPDTKGSSSSPEPPKIALQCSSSRAAFFFVPFLLLTAYLLVLPFLQKYLWHDYWLNHDEISFVFSPDEIRQINDTTLELKKGGLLSATITGRVKVGTYAGHTGPEGIKTGLLGVPLGSAYNRDDAKNFNHAAMLYKNIKVDSLQWKAVPVPYRIYWLKEARHATFGRMNKGDILQFCLNDKELQNNSGHFRVQLTICDTCKQIRNN
jgi:hypothetical protein